MRPIGATEMFDAESASKDGLEKRNTIRVSLAVKGNKLRKDFDFYVTTVEQESAAEGSGVATPAAEEWNRR